MQYPQPQRQDTAERPVPAVTDVMLYWKDWSEQNRRATTGGGSGTTALGLPVAAAEVQCCRSQTAENVPPDQIHDPRSFLSPRFQLLAIGGVPGADEILAQGMAR